MLSVSKAHLATLPIITHLNGNPSVLLNHMERFAFHKIPSRESHLQHLILFPFRNIHCFRHSSSKLLVAHPSRAKWTTHNHPSIKHCPVNFSNHTETEMGHDHTIPKHSPLPESKILVLKPWPLLLHLLFHFQHQSIHAVLTYYFHTINISME